MQNQRLNITLPPQLARDLKRTVPKRSRSKFIAEALGEKLKKKKDPQKELAKSLKANNQYDQMQMKEWSVLETEGWPD